MSGDWEWCVQIDNDTIDFGLEDKGSAATRVRAMRAAMAMIEWRLGGMDDGEVLDVVMSTAWTIAAAERNRDKAMREAYAAGASMREVADTARMSFAKAKKIIGAEPGGGGR